MENEYRNFILRQHTTDELKDPQTLAVIAGDMENADRKFKVDYQIELALTSNIPENV